jgi:hypothetical protein
LAYETRFASSTGVFALALLNVVGSTPQHGKMIWS